MALKKKGTPEPIEVVEVDVEETKEGKLKVKGKKKIK